MKKDCAYIRKSLRKYLRGHLFKYEQVRIARHLNACPVCRSEFQALKKVADTKQLIKDITPPEGFGQRIKNGFFGLRKLKLLLYRPLWVVAIIGAGTLLYINIIAPSQRDIEIENIEKSLPPSATMASAPTMTPADGQALPAPVARTAAEPAASASPSVVAAPAADPLVITITPENNEAALQQINDVMQGQGQLGKTRFSRTVRKVSGSLSAQELLAFFKRIEGSGKVSYSRKRFESFPSAQLIPFVMKMNRAPKMAEQPSSPGPAVSPPAETAAAEPASAPSQSTR